MSGIERYEIERELGRGAMGVVSLAHDIELDREVAVKEMAGASTLPPERQAELVERFEREARAAGGLDSPNIVKVYDSFVDEDRHFLVMEYLDGPTLDAVLKSGPLPPEAAMGVATQVLGALKIAHEAGIVHRDLKPENIFVLSDGLVKVADFGIARTDDSGGLTQAGQVLGTLGYMSPEQVRGQVVDCRSDIFSLGVIIHEMLAGQNPFAADQPTTVMYRIAYEEPPALDLVVTGLPPHLGAVIKKATAKDLEQRYASAEEMLKDIEDGVAPDVTAIEAASEARIAAQAAGGQMPPVKVKRLPKFSKKTVLIALAAAVIVLAVAGGGYAFVRDKQAKDAARMAAIRAEAVMMIGRVAEIKGLRVELERAVGAVDKKAAANVQAVAKWDTDLDRRESDYEARVREVDSHNANEYRKREESTYQEWDYWSYTYYTYYTYEPRTWSYPSQPSPPAKVKIDLKAEKAAVADVEARLTAFRSSIATEAASTQYFGVVYQRMTEAVDALLKGVADSKTMLSSLVVTHPQKGDVVTQSKVGMVKLSSLDVAFGAVDQEVSLYTKNYGLKLEELLSSETSKTPEASESSKTPAAAEASKTP